MNESMNTLITESLVIINNLHFIRASWFYAFIPLILYLIFANNKTQSNRNWFSVIDQQLLPFVLTTDSKKRRRYPLLLTFIAVSLCITALAGPVYKKLPQPVYRELSSLVVLLDLSQSMNASDIKPSRLARAKLELLDILKTRKTGQTALIVYAADAFVVTPLTDDNATIANLAPSLETDMMPAQGSNLSTALSKTAALFKQAGIFKGDILVITDDIRQGDEDAIKKIFAQGFRLSILGTGTAEGAPVPLDSGFLQDSNGAIVIPKLHAEKLQKYALSAGGIYTGLHADDSDINKLTQIFQSSEITQDNTTKDLNADIWQEEGYWLLLPLLFFAALWARKGWIAVILIFILPLPSPAYAEAAAENPYLNTKHLWSSPDQKAMKDFNHGDNENAAREFTQSDWKASAYYRNGDYQAAANVLEKTDHSDGFYNRANALAQLGNYEEAIKAYDKAIELNENNEDAIYNREQVKKALQQQQKNSEQQDSEQQDSEQNESDKDESEQDKSDQEKSDQQQDQQEDSEKKDSKQQDSSSQNNEENQQQSEQSEQQPENTESDEQRSDEQRPDEKQPDESQQQEEQELKQRDAETEKQQQEKEQSQYEKDQHEQKKQDNAEQDSNAQENDNLENKESEDKPMEIEVNPVEASITEQEKATEQWLKRIPDDPGGLLRRKFLYQYKQIPNQSDENEPW